jgi:signal transduction histidine kinase
MDDRPTGLTSGLRSKPVAPLTRPRGLGLSWRLLLLTVLFVMASEVLIYVPSIANFRSSWLADRLTMADTAALVIVGGASAEVPRRIQNDLLAAIGATAIAIRNGATSRLIATVDMPPNVDITADLRIMNPVNDIVDAFGTLVSASEHTLRVIGVSRSGAQIELVMGDRALRAAMLRYSVRILWLAALISVITGALLYFTLNRLIIRPMRHLTQNMVAFSTDPENPARIIVPGGRGDEIGIAEKHLAAMQSDLQGTLREQRHLADLGLAVSKINHDLRNLLASAQLFSDRLGSLPDPTVQRFAPKLIAALDRAIAYAQSTLAYGRAREAPPERRLVALDRLVDDVADALGLNGHATIAFENQVPAGLEVDADPDQLFRVLVNLGRNAIQALDGGDQSAAVVRRLTMSASRDGGNVAMRVRDTGPGVPERARSHLFQAFQGGARPGGTGLGLAIAAEIIRAHGGSIALVDTAGPGATFEIVIPDRPGRNGRNGRNAGG